VNESKTSRLDTELVSRGIVSTRSQAESYIKLGQVQVSGKTITKPGYKVAETDKIKFYQGVQYVSRAALKLESAVEALGIDFKGKVVLDVGSSTGGFTEYSIRHGAKKVIAVDVGTQQMHESLRDNPLIELHEKTDIRDFKTGQKIDIILADVSFISLRQILPFVARLANRSTMIVPMVKPQFEAASTGLKHKGVIKNDSMRRKVLVDFEQWVKKEFAVIGKTDSKVSGSKGNLERFYSLKKL
jgi:23S rRNA (cytidine1920-2'-O)/16S rRNA (cytidine1409-2'-O)-methyltransferase